MNIQDNGKLASIVAPSSTVLAEPIAAIAVTLRRNALTGEYTQAIEGAETEPYTQAVIASDDLNSFKSFIVAYTSQSDRISSTSASATSGVQSITYSMDIDVVTIDATATATATLQAAQVSNTAAQKGLDKIDGTVDDATDATNASDALFNLRS